jgi:hypothetical protein
MGLEQVPDWVFKGTADHDWKTYDDVYNQDWCVHLNALCIFRQDVHVQYFAVVNSLLA